MLKTWLSVETAVFRFLESLHQPLCILVACSGGSDSTGLLLALAKALQSNRFPHISLCAATVDHALRAESQKEAQAVAALCQSLEIPHRLLTWTDDKPASGLMAAAREARYGLLSQAARMMKANLIVTGHTLNDQQETLAMQNARAHGKTSSGICDHVLFDRDMWIARPFLQCRRDNIRDFLIHHGVHWSDDPSNENTQFERIRVRQNPPLASFDGTLIEQAQRRRFDLADQASHWLDHCFSVPIPGLGLVQTAGLAAETDLLDYALGRLIAAWGGNAFAPGQAAMDRLLKFLVEKTATRITLGHVMLHRRAEGLYLVREARNLPRIVIAPHQRTIWDGRFKIHNQSVATINVVAQAIRESQTHKTLKHLAASTLPMVENFHDDQSTISIETYCAPFDHFLTGFDYCFAQKLAALCRQPPYPVPPFKNY